jgi:HSF-type DNA-binding
MDHRQNQTTMFTIGSSSSSLDEGRMITSISADMNMKSMLQPTSDSQNSLGLMQAVSVLSVSTAGSESASSSSQCHDLAATHPAMETMVPSHAIHADVDPSGSHLKFPFKLHHILSEAERLGFVHIIGWTPAGDGFRVYEPKSFARTIMPKYFGMSHYKSFQRQLSLYSFKRATEGVNRGKYASSTEHCRTEIGSVPHFVCKIGHRSHLLF